MKKLTKATVALLAAMTATSALADDTSIQAASIFDSVEMCDITNVDDGYAVLVLNQNLPAGTYTFRCNGGRVTLTFRD